MIHPLDEPAFTRMTPLICLEHDELPAPIMSSVELVETYCWCLGLEDCEWWPAADAIACHDPVTGSQFCAALEDSLEITRCRLAEHRWRFGR